MKSTFLRSLARILSVTLVFALFGPPALSQTAAGPYKVGDLVYDEKSSRLGTVTEVKEGQYFLRFKEERENPPEWLEGASLRPMEESEREEWGRWEQHRAERAKYQAEKKAEEEAEAQRKATREKLAKTSGNLVYAVSGEKTYFRGVKGERKEGKTLIYWEDDGEPTWVPNSKIRPRKGHGLKPSQIGDRAPTAAELAAKAQKAKERAALAEARCPRFKTYLDCSTTFEPCVWNTAEKACFYRGY